MISAFEAKTAARENKMRIEAKQFERLVKDIERRILEAINCGRGYIGINSELSCLSEVAKYFDALGYETLGIRLNDEEKAYIIWDKEVWTKELGIEEKKGLKEN